MELTYEEGQENDFMKGIELLGRVNKGISSTELFRLAKKVCEEQKINASL